MAVTEAMQWGPAIQSTDTYASKIGQMEDVEFAIPSKTIEYTLKNGTNVKFGQAYSNIWLLDEGYRETADNNKFIYEHLTNTFLEKVDTFLEANDGLKDYIIPLVRVRIQTSAGHNSYVIDQITGENILTKYGYSLAFVDIHIRLIHKEDFINLCNKILDLNKWSTNQITVDTVSLYGFIFNHGYTDDTTYKFLHDVYKIDYSGNAYYTQPDGTGYETALANFVDDMNALFANGITTEVVAQETKIIRQVLTSFTSFYNANYSVASGSQYISNSKQVICNGISGAYGTHVKSYGQPDAGEGGGDGEEDNESVSMDLPPLPTYGLLETHFGRIYAPAPRNLIDLAAYLWDSNNVWEDFWQDLEKKFTHPIDAIMGLFVSNVKPQDPPGTNMQFQVGGKVFMVDGQPVNIPYVSQQYIEVDCGTVQIKEYFSSFLDYNPYTSIELYLPFIGTITIDTDEFMGKSMNIKYRIDLMTGALQCYVILVNGDYHVAKYIENGNCFAQLPVTSGNFQQFISTVLKCAAAGAATAVTAGSVAAIGGAGAAAGAASTAAKGGVVSLSKTATVASTGLALSDKQKFQIGAGLVGAAASAVKGSKDRVQKAGGTGQALPLFGYKKPFLTISRPNQSLPVNYAHFKGRPSNITSKLSSLSGYTEVEFVRIENIAATDDEKHLIQEALINGVIL